MPVARLSRCACSPSRRNRGDVVLSEMPDTPNPRPPNEQNSGTRSNEERLATEEKRRCIKQRSRAHRESAATYEPGELAVWLTSQIGFVVHNLHSRSNRWRRPSCFRHTPVPGNDNVTRTLLRCHCSQRLSATCREVPHGAQDATRRERCSSHAPILHQVAVHLASL